MMMPRALHRLLLVLACALVMLGSGLPAGAVQPDEMLKDPALEGRARTLSSELRCLVCQNQSIDDSDAPLAHDLRVLVRERLVAGDSDQQVLDYLVSRYGEFVLLRPRLSWSNALLWVAPFAVLIIGAVASILAFRRRRQAAVAAQAALTPEEEARFKRLLRETPPSPQ
ncbi:cytochrome c-type biogenesis protein [Xanthobacter sp. NFM-26]|uniref:cytochrome c-type biogenesis protein n=2 Tax=unclassified Xanthobacter TaxID=2623496 RepID=UPI001EDCE3B7|nr:cytochrome c-type biogenesis protein [Xanthobacter sp. NFM-26]